jgi:DAACS family dicarboxylate/amino acid:cation (Na+ or H+) symporter
LDHETAFLFLGAVLAGIGTAGVPGGSLPAVVLLLQAAGVPGEGIGVIIGVDRFLDMCRTTLNVTGDITAAMWVDRGESEVSGEPQPETALPPGTIEP